MPSLIRQFKDQPSLCGKVSVFIYGFVIRFGGATTLFAIFAPILAADCMAEPFLDTSSVQADQGIWFKSDGRSRVAGC